MADGPFTDLRIAARALRRRKTFALAVIATLGLGIGANTAVFSVVNAVVLHPLSLPNASRVVTTYEATTRNPFGASAYATFDAVAKHTPSLTEVATFFSTSMTMADGDVVEERTGALVSESYFRLIGAQPRLGRYLGPGDALGGGQPVTVISYRLWQTRFGGDRGVIGRSVKVAGRTITVVGVAGERFRGTTLAAVPDLWLPIQLVRSLQLGLLSRMDFADPASGVRLFTIVGRLAPAATIASVERDANAVLARLADGSAHGHLTFIPVNDGATTLRDRATLLRFVRLLLVVVGLTLLLACLNIANLLFVRGRERAREIGVRAALGASVFRLTRELMAESLLLSFLGGIAGLGIAEVTLRLLAAFALPGGVVIGELALALDARVLAFTMILALATAVVAGLAPAIHGSRVDVTTVIRDARSNHTSHPGRGALLIVQIAITFVLVVGAALMVRSLRRGLDTDVGFRADRLAAVTAQTSLDGRQEDDARTTGDILRALRATSGIAAAAATSHLPLAPGRALPFADGAGGGTPQSLRRTTMTLLAAVSPEYFATIGVPIIQGRAFTADDRRESPRVIIVNEAAARAFWGGTSPLNKQISLFDDRTYTVVGVVHDTKYVSLEDHDVPFAFAPIAQEEVRGALSFVVRGDKPRAALQGLATTVAGLAPTWRISHPRLVSDQIATILMPQRFGAVLLSVFSFVALVVSGVGIYGTVAYAMERRRTEIGVRLALGAQAADILRALLRESALALAAGLVVGGVAAAASARLLAHFLYDVDPFDGPSFAAAVLAVVTAAMIAVAVPAIRALRVDPVRAIRSQ